MLLRSLAALLAVNALAACTYLGGNPNVAGDGPGVNASTAGERKDVAFCPGGDRAKACILGKSCRITEQGCQVCQCQTPE